MRKPINVAIVGLGRWGELLVSSVDDSQVIRFAAAVTRTPSKAIEFCASRNISLSSDLDDVLNDDSVDTVVIATPHSQHFNLIMLSVAAGKHVYCEKPWKLEVGEARVSLNALADAGLKAGVGHNRRFAPNILAMKKILEEGKLGTPIHIDGHFHANLAPPEGA